MQDGNKDKNRKKGGSPWVAIAVMLAATVISSLENGRDGAVIVMMVVILAVLGAIVALVAVKKKAAGGAKTTPYQTQTANDSKPRQSLKSSTATEGMKPFSIFTKEATMEDFSFSHKKKPESCDYGQVNHTFSHDQQRRLEQLDSFLKNGLIEKDEYRKLRARYMKETDER